jgi:hypothetical protein
MSLEFTASRDYFQKITAGTFRCMGYFNALFMIMQSNK